MPSYLGIEIINQTAFRIASVTPEYSILRADYGDGYADTANVGMPGGVKSFTAVAGLWSDDSYYGSIEGQAWMEYYWNFLHARLQAGNAPFIVNWRDAFWTVDMDEPRFAIEALRSFNSDMFVPAAIRLNTRRIRGVDYNSDGSIVFDIWPPVQPDPDTMTTESLGPTGFRVIWEASTDPNDGDGIEDDGDMDDGDIG